MYKKNVLSETTYQWIKRTLEKKCCLLWHIYGTV